MDLGSVPADYWNEVIRAYIQACAVLEVRTVKLSEDSFIIVTADKDVESPETHWPVAERFEFRVQDSIAADGVDEICGELCRLNHGQPGPTFNARMAWDDRLFGWSSCVGQDDRHLVVLCGNVLRFVAEQSTDGLPLLFEWDRPDAPKDADHRRWLLGPRTPELVAAFQGLLR